MVAWLKQPPEPRDDAAAALAGPEGSRCSESELKCHGFRNLISALSLELMK